MVAPLIWSQQPCDGAAAEALQRALGIEPIDRAPALPARPRHAGEREPLPEAVARSPARPVRPRGHAARRSTASLAAVSRRERIAVHGDYDVDGITSTVILRRCLELLGGDVVHFIPDRLKDGYGLQPATIERLHAEGARVVVSVDCGIRGVEAAAARARSRARPDHHRPPRARRHAAARARRHQPEAARLHVSPTSTSPGVGVALKLVQALCARSGRDSWLPAFVKIAAIGTLADVVPLVGENRVIAKLGLDLLSKGPHKVGLRALIEAAGLTGKTIDSYHIGFVIAPRVNAAGRMSTPDIATRLLLAVRRGDGGRGARARRTAERGKHAPPAGRGDDRRGGEEDRRERS